MVIRGKYRILRQIGRGGMGTVYLAEHIMLSRLRALKFISSELSQDAIFLRRFRREAQAAIGLHHPNIVEVVDLDQAEDGTPYIAMEYVEGPGLRQALANGAMQVERALIIAWGIAQGLGAAHAKGIVHRDVKPENILLAGGNGFPEIPKLLDFGIAAMKESATVASHTRGLMLTPPYAAPEQWKGMAAEELDGRADIYALGGVLYEMLTGHTPFHAHNTEGWLYQHLYADPRPPGQLRPELDNFPGLDALVLQMLERDRERRFPSVLALLEALAPLLPAQPVPTFFDTPHTLHPMVITGPRLDSVPVNLPKDRNDSLRVAEPSRKSSKVKWIVAAAVIVAGLAGLGIWSSTGFSGFTPATTTTQSASKPPEVATPAVSAAPAEASLYDQAKSAYEQKQFVHARQLFKQACEADDMRACSYLGYLYYQGLGGDQSAVLAEGAYRMACDKGIFSSCTNLGTIYQDLGKIADARKYFKKGCDGGSAEGCDLLRGVQ